MMQALYPIKYIYATFLYLFLSQNNLYFGVLTLYLIFIMNFKLQHFDPDLFKPGVTKLYIPTRTVAKNFSPLLII